MTQSRSARRPRPRRTEHRSSVRFLMIFLLTTSMIATGGFGTFPENSITQTFQEEIGQNFPPEFLNPINLYLENISAPTIEPVQASESERTIMDPVGFLIDFFGANTTIPPSQPNAINATEAFETAMNLVANTQTQSAILTTTSVSISPTVTTTIHTLTPSITAATLPSSTSTNNPTQTFIPVIIPPTRTPQSTDVNTPLPTNTLTPTLTLTNTITYTPSLTPTFTLTSTPTLTPTNTLTPTPGNNSCVKNSPNTSTYGCLISNIRLNGIPQTTLTVLANQSFTLEYDFQVWSDPACPTCAMQIIAGLEATSAPICDYSNIPNVFPGFSGGSNVHTFSSSTTGTKAIFIRWVQQAGCNVANYSGFGTVIALITVQ